jgi:hypothetical protein
LRAPGVGRLGAISALVLISAAVLPAVPLRMETTTEMSATDAKIALRHLRGVLDGRTDPSAPLPAALRRFAGDRVPLVLTEWRNGHRIQAFQVEDRPLDEALRELGAALAGGRTAALGAQKETRLELDVAIAEGWAPPRGLLFAMSFVEGWTGVSGLVGGRRIYVAPSELIRSQRYGSFTPFPGVDARFRIGLSADSAARAVKLQAEQLGLGASKAPDGLSRFTALTVVEGDDLSPRTLLKGTVERPPLTRRRLEQAVRGGARYLMRSLKPDGLFRYNYDPLRNKDVDDAYNWPRHAGTAYSLALMGRLLGDDAMVDAAGRALARFAAEVARGPGGTRCLLENGGCYLGSSALGLLALSEHRIAAGDARFAETARGLAEFVMRMQRDDGFFYHDWAPERGIDRASMKLYASQQAVFALARYGRAFGDRRALDAAEKGMDYLAGPYWDHFLGTYFFGQEHWSCLAAEEMFAVRPKRQYADLCLAIGENYDRLCHAPGDTPFSEDVGGMSITHMFTPHIGGTATAAEAMVSAVALGRQSGVDVAPIERQLRSTLGFLEKGQLTRDDAFWLPSPRNALGGILESQTKMRIRIDTVQHAISAMARGRDYVFPELDE